jgi:hypothetical protein
MKEKARFEMERRRLEPKPTGALVTMISNGEVGTSGIGKLSMLGSAKALDKLVPKVTVGVKKTQMVASNEGVTGQHGQIPNAHRDKVHTLVADKLAALPSHGTVAKAAAATVAVTRTMGAVKTEVTKVAAGWTARTTTPTSAKTMTDTEATWTAPRINNSTAAPQSVPEIELQMDATTKDDFITLDTRTKTLQ